MYFNEFKSNQPFLCISWQLNYIDSILGAKAPSGKEDQVWVVSFDLQKLKGSSIQEFKVFHSFIGSIIDELNVPFEFKSAPLTQIETNQIWLGAPCGYEQLWIDKASTEENSCTARFKKRIEALEKGVDLSIYESLVNISRNVTKEFTMSNMALGKAIVDKLNAEIVPEIASLSLEGYCAEPVYYDY
jgi:hypothetical protein